MVYGEDYRTQLRGQPRLRAKTPPSPHSLLAPKTEPTTPATIGRIVATGKPNSVTPQRDCGTGFGLRSGDPLGDELLQSPQMAVVNTALFEVLHRVVEIVGA